MSLKKINFGDKEVDKKNSIHLKKLKDLMNSIHLFY